MKPLYNVISFESPTGKIRKIRDIGFNQWEIYNSVKNCWQHVNADRLIKYWRNSIAPTRKILIEKNES